MRGSDAQSLENTILEKFDDIDELKEQNELKTKIDATVKAYYDGDYSKLVSYRGKAARIEGWGEGGAIQYEFSLSIEQLEAIGLIKEIK